MKTKKVSQKIIKFTEKFFTDENISKDEILRVSKILSSSNHNLNIYKGILSIYNFFKFDENLFPEFKYLLTDKIFLKCNSFLKGHLMKPSEVGDLFSNILKIDGNSEYKDVLMGCFFGSFWPFMNNSDNFKISSDYGVEIAKSAFNVDNFDIYKKIQCKNNKKQIISMAGSGKKEIKLLNISTMSAIITVAVSKKFGYNIALSKTISKATSSVSGSTDIFEILGVNLNTPIDKMTEIMLEIGLGVFDINMMVPKLNSFYDGKLYNVQVFAGLIGGAAIVNPINADLINYGLTRGSSKLCLEILSKIYPKKNIIILQGENLKKESIIDQISINGNTQVSMRIKEKNEHITLNPKDFGFDFTSFKYLKTGNNKEENLKKFISFLKGSGNKALEQIVATEVSMNLFGLGIVDNLMEGASIATSVIKSGKGVDVIKELIKHTDGDIKRFNQLLNSNSDQKYYGKKIIQLSNITKGNSKYTF